MAKSKGKKGARSPNPSLAPPPPASPPRSAHSPALSGASTAVPDDEDDDDHSDTFEDAVAAEDNADRAAHSDNAPPGDQDGEVDTHAGDEEGEPDTTIEHELDAGEPGATNGDAGGEDSLDGAGRPPDAASDGGDAADGAALALSEPSPRSSGAVAAASRPASMISNASSSSAAAAAGRRLQNRLSLSLSDDDEGASEAQRDDGDDDDDERSRHEGDDSLSDLPLGASPSAASTSKRPFSLSSEPETPTASSPPSSPSRTRTRPPAARRRSSLLASSLAASHDPTNVGRDQSASLTQAVWRQSMGLNASVSSAAEGLMDVQLDGRGSYDEDDEEEGGPLSTAQTPRAERTYHPNRLSGVFAPNGYGPTSPTSPSTRQRVHRRSLSDPSSSSLLSSIALDGVSASDDPSDPSTLSTTPPDTPGPPSSSYSRPASLAPAHPVRDRQASIATPHAADGFLAQRYSTTLSSLPVPAAEKRQSHQSTGIQKLQQEFERVRERERERGAEGAAAGGGQGAIDWDFWGRVMVDYEQVAREQPRELSRAIQRGIPPALRGMTWQLMAAAKDANLEFIYSELLKQSSPHEKSIARDLSRTFPKHAYFSDAGGVGQENLFNVVKAYSLYDEDVGYTQGLQFIVGPLLLNMPDEEAFCVLVRLMKAYDLRSHYTPNMPGLQLRLFQFDRLVEELVPSVFLHLLRQGVKSSMYASQWFLTLFGYRFPLELVSSVFDLVFAEGVEAVFRFAVALLKRNETHLLTLEFEDLIEFLKNGLFEVYAPDEDELEQDPNAQYKVHEFVREALQVRITPMMLDQFGEEWASLCAAQTAHTAELEALRKANLQLSLQVRQLETSLAQINQEHCELVKTVVAARLEREELEDELVKYKLAYADLSHLAASERATTSPLQLRRQSEMSIASSLDGAEQSPSSSVSGSGSAGGPLGGLGLGGRWFGGGSNGRASSSAMSASGSSGY
ncbi:hypothetical protein Rhopal_005372-T1 [Rhodotorula paludigena]|uniref:Rab-GAP TBC domain-containing protein n=1 Tax=Rhodotorula paludigena TaxID=86838 RepID=A0AAV5GS75_9BASI|nr:hypothetical protein Rhopal_005372-T1 [Rhodotorula paludigena]